MNTSPLKGNISRGSAFHHFPLSSLLKGLLAKQATDLPEFVVNVFFMRLAAQETRERLGGRGRGRWGEGEVKCESYRHGFTAYLL